MCLISQCFWQVTTDKSEQHDASGNTHTLVGNVNSVKEESLNLKNPSWLILDRGQGERVQQNMEEVNLMQILEELRNLTVENLELRSKMQGRDTDKEEKHMEDEEEEEEEEEADL